MKSEILTEEKVENKDRKFGSRLIYYPCVIDGKKALFTENQLKIAIERGKKNTEDFEEESF
jgi:hypothetical protein